MVEPAPIMNTFPVLVIDTTPEDKVEKVNEAVLLEARDIVKSGSVKSFVISGAEIIGSALLTVIAVSYTHLTLPTNREV